MESFSLPAKVLHPPDEKGLIFHLSKSLIVLELDITCVTEQRARVGGIEEKASTGGGLRR